MKYYCITATINHKRHHYLIKAESSYKAVKELSNYVNANDVTRLIIRESEPLNVK